jgi:predicted DCC family thiol-disulfide oxidoreductase YuxK
MLMMHFSLLVLIDFADLSLGMVMLHLFTFDPAWIKPRQPLPCPPPRSGEGAGGEVELLFYDGHCGLCHRMVRFLLAEDRAGTAFRFCPLDSETFRNAVAESDRLGLPDSLVLRTAEGTILTRSVAVIHILKRLGGVWRLVGGLGACIPRKLGDRIYDGIAAIRHRLFRTPDSTCPLIPPSLRARFEL